MQMILNFYNLLFINNLYLVKKHQLFWVKRLDV